MEFSQLIRISQVENVNFFLSDTQNMFYGAIVISPHYFFVTDHSRQVDSPWIQTRLIDSVSVKSVTSENVVEIKLKNFVKCEISLDSFDKATLIAVSLDNLSKVTDIQHQLALAKKLSVIDDGWNLYGAESDLYDAINTGLWRISYVNADYTLCDTYSQQCAVPSTISDETLRIGADCRQGNRFPILVMLYGVNPICKAGPFSNNRSKQENMLLDAIASSSPQGGYIVDVSPTNNNNPQIRQWKILRKPLDDVRLKTPGDISWLDMVRECLKYACLVSQCVSREQSAVLVQGETSRVAVVVSLASILLIPVCRNYVGFQSLICREWCHAGHSFQSIEGRLMFTLFLDCVWQLLQQFPSAFEFSEDLLHLILTNSCASSYGTFLCNSELERAQAGLQLHSSSIWTYLSKEDVKAAYKNPLYRRRDTFNICSVAPQSIKVWRSLYYQSHNESYQKELSKAAEVADENIMLINEIERLEAAFKSVIMENGDKT